MARTPVGICGVPFTHSAQARLNMFQISAEPVILSHPSLLSDCLKCFTITGKTEQTNDVDTEGGQVENRKGIVRLRLPAASNGEISSSVQRMTVI